MPALAHSMPAEPANPSSGARLIATGGRALPLRHSHLDAQAQGGIARVILTQRFVNPHATPLHVTYLLPLPSDGAVSGFSFSVGELRVVGEVDRKGRARERFEAALVEGRTAALLEQDRSSLFTQEVGNIPPGEELVAEIEIDQPLRWLEEGAWELRFPTVVGPRYMGGAGVVADAERVTVDVAEGGLSTRASLRLRIGDAITGRVESPSHRIALDEDEVRFHEARLDRDVVVRWPVAVPSPGVSVQLARPADPRHGGLAYGLLTVVPPESATAPVSHARDLTLLIDTSGSMGGRPLDQARRVALALVDTLGDRDRIEMIEFGTKPERFSAEPMRATRDGKRAARKWLKGLRARGGTEMHRAILEALRPLRDDAQRQVVLMTDGFIGFESKIVKTLLDDMPPGVRLHTVGVGSAPNRSLTEAAARAGRGVELIVGLEEDAERVVSRLLVRTEAPLLTELTIDGARAVAPQHPPDLHAGCPALVSFAVADGTEAITVRGRTPDGVFERTVSLPPLDLGEGPEGVTARFGRERVEDLETAFTATRDRSYEGEIEDVGLRFSIATRLTSWIAVTDEVTVDDPTNRRHERQPHELADGLQMESLGLRAPSGESSGVLFSLNEMMSLEDEEVADRPARLAQTRTGIAKPSPELQRLFGERKADLRARAGRAQASPDRHLLAGSLPGAPMSPGSAQPGGTKDDQLLEVAPARKRASSRFYLVSAMIIVILLAVAVVFGWWLASRPSSEPTPPTEESSLTVRPGD